MVQFGLLSSAFDLLTFATLLLLFRAAAPTFRTGWFVESLLTELLVAFVVRTRGPFYLSRPGSLLVWLSVATAVLAFVIPFLPVAPVLGFVPMPAEILATLVGISLAYVLATELMKRRFYKTAV